MTDLIVNLLKSRGIDTDNEEEVEKFLSPDWDKHTHDPFLMKDMDKAVQRIKKAIDSKEKIVIYSDYDCDGIPGGVILHDFLSRVGANFINHIPHRHKDGYGVHKNAIDGFLEGGVSLMITVDLGITNIEEVAYAQNLGLDVIVTDHHLTVKDKSNNDILPTAYAVLNTKRQDCDYPEKMLCGCATAWKLAHGFLIKYRSLYNIPEGFEKWWLDMVGISTIADMVPLIGENRVLAIYGLKVLKKSKRQGLLRILSNAKIKQSGIDETDIGFGIAPRINSASRMADPKDAFFALLDNENAMHYAEKLETYNKDRKIETSLAKNATKGLDFSGSEVVLCGNLKWQAGILGLIASSISDNTKKTTFVWGAEEGGVVKGSVRSGQDGADVVQQMKGCKELLVAFGGHESAGGFSLRVENIDSFREKLNVVYSSIKDTFAKNDDKKVEEIIVDDKDVDKNIYNEIQKLAPFGEGNPAPLIRVNLSENIKSAKMFGSGGDHYQAYAKDLYCVKFFSEKDYIAKTENIKYVLGYLEKDSYRNGIMLKMI